MTREYIQYLYSYLYRNGPNNGKRPMSFETWCDWVGKDEDCDDYQSHMKYETRQGLFV